MRVFTMLPMRRWRDAAPFAATAEAAGFDALMTVELGHEVFTPLAFAALATERIARIEAVLAGEPSDGLDIRYYVPWQQCWSGSGPGVDLVMSQAVLEHVEDIEGVHRSLAAGLKIGGAASHVIDFRCHKMAGTWDGHLQYGDRLWKIVKGRRPYLLNRRSPSEHLRAMESAGFEILRAARVEAAPTIPRSSLAGRFSSWDEADRSTATMVVIARRIS